MQRGRDGPHWLETVQLRDKQFGSHHAHPLFQASHSLLQLVHPTGDCRA